MKRKTLVCIFSALFFYSQAQNKTYYISSSGNDASDGLSTLTAWQSLTKVNSLDLKPGDKILLRGGDNFGGSIQLTSEDRGTAENPILVGSYGTGKATVTATNAHGLFAQNCGGIEIRDLIIEGNGSDYSGIYFLITQASADIAHIRISRVEVYSFGSKGCLIGANNTDKGFNDIVVSESTFHDNGVGGMEIFGSWPQISHTQFAIRYCKFYNNLGTFLTSSCTGNGLVVSGVDGGVVEFCEAYNNGVNNRNSGGGPVGIWTYDTKNIIIQFCESHHNKAGLYKDGGGFDIDGGSQYCIIQYCYSHDNEGPGFALVEYGSPNEFTGNIIRYNLSQDDARKNSYGALILYAVNALHPVKNSAMYNNTIYVSTDNLVDGNPSAISILSGNFINVKMGNTILYVTAGIDFIHSLSAGSTSELYFLNNNYYSTASTYHFLWAGIAYTSVADWKAGASGQEMQAGHSTEIMANPLLMAPGTSGTIHPADGGSFNSLFGYFLSNTSPVINKGAQLADMGNRDFYGTAVPQQGSYDIGAMEFFSFNNLPVILHSFTASSNETRTRIQWEVSHEELVKKYEIQKSDNGVVYSSIGSIEASNAGHYLFYDAQTSNDAYYRLNYIYADGRSQFSQVIRVLKTPVQKVEVGYLASRGLQVRLQNRKEETAWIHVYDINGRMVYSSQRSFTRGSTTLFIDEAVKWKSAVYFVEFTSSETNVTVKCSIQ